MLSVRTSQPVDVETWITHREPCSVTPHCRRQQAAGQMSRACASRISRPSRTPCFDQRRSASGDRSARLRHDLTPQHYWHRVCVHRLTFYLVHCNVHRMCVYRLTHFIWPVLWFRFIVSYDLLHALVPLLYIASCTFYTNTLIFFSPARDSAALIT